MDHSKNNLFEDPKLLKIENVKKIKITNSLSIENITTTEVEYSKIVIEESNFESNKKVSRKIRSTSSNVSTPQTQQFCSSFGDQPCTCYYPDHPNVTLF